MRRPSAALVVRKPESRTDSPSSFGAAVMVTCPDVFRSVDTNVPVARTALGATVGTGVGVNVLEAGAGAALVEAPADGRWIAALPAVQPVTAPRRASAVRAVRSGRRTVIWFPRTRGAAQPSR